MSDMLVVWPNDPKLSDCGGRRSLCGKVAGAGLRVGAQAVTPGAVRCSGLFGFIRKQLIIRLSRGAFIGSG
jgi:hypothetical protein